MDKRMENHKKNSRYLPDSMKTTSVNQTDENSTVKVSLHIFNFETEHVSTVV